MLPAPEAGLGQEDVHFGTNLCPGEPVVLQATEGHELVGTQSSGEIPSALSMCV